jgi:mannose/fructose/N-acetylgalactosamine-specific phosphotransferase system component IIC
VRWFKLAAIVVAVMIAFLVVSSVIGFLLEAVIAVLAVAAVVLGVKVAFNRKQVAWKSANAEVRGPGYSRPQRRHNTSHVDDELARLKREMGG